MINSDWRRIVRKAWSVRFIVLAGLFSGLELVLPLYIDHFPRDVFAGMTIVATIAAFAARIYAQKSMQDET